MTLQQIGSQDAQFLYVQTPENQTHTTLVAIYDPSTAPGGTVRFKDIIAHIESRLNQSPLFRRKLHRLPLDFDYPYWVEDKDFDIEAHISHSRLPMPGDWRQLCILTARHHSRPMDMTRPLWDMMVVEGLDDVEGYPKGCFALICRIHHVTIDGASGMFAFLALSDLDAEGTPAVRLTDEKPDHGREPTMLEAYNRAMTSNMTSPVKMANSLARFAPAIFDIAQKNVTGAEDENKVAIPHTRFNSAVSPHKVFDAASVALADLKAIKQKVPGATLNDVVLAVCGGALRAYLKHHKELPDKPLVGWVPINARKAGDEKGPGNRISALTVPIGTHIEDPMRRLQAIKARTKEAKTSKGSVARMLTDLTQHVPGMTMAPIAQLVASERFSPVIANAFITNVPGAPVPLYMAGAKGLGTFGMAPISNNMGLMIVAMSYAGRMSFTITSDRKIMPDIAYFRECMQDSVAKMLAAPAPEPEKNIPQAEPEPVRAKPVAKPQAAKKRVKEINP